MKENEGIPHTKELHGVKLASGRGNFKSGKHNFSKAKASSVYRNILRNLDHFLPEASIMSACANRGRHLYGNERLEAGLLALFQRMRTQTNRRNASAITFFDQGHPEYRQLYRKSQIYLPTGSAYGVGSRNLPMSMFFEDGNEKNSKHCYFTQVADIVAYAAFLKIKSERGELTEWQSTYNMGTLYDEIPKRLINTRVTQSAPQDGIVRLN